MIILTLCVLCVIALLYYGFSIYASLALFSGAKAPHPQFFPPISILKPLCGLDGNVYQNLATFCHQNYPTYQILFGVRDSVDPVIDVVKQLIQDFPQVDIRLIVDDQVIGTNLKVSNLANLGPHVKYDFILVSDSDIRVGPDYLQQIIQPMKHPSTGVVTCLYRSRVYSPIAAIEALSISTDFHAAVLVAQQIGWMKFAMGSSILIRADALAKIGGFEAIADHLADDFMLGNLTANAGYNVVLSDYVVEHTLTTQSFRDLIAHQTRWNRCTRVANPWGYVGLLLTHGTTLSLFILLLSQGSHFGWGVLLVVWTARFGMGWVVGVHGLKDQVAAEWFWFIPLRDLLSFALWAYGFMGDRIVWRGKQFRVSKGGTLQSLDRQRWDYSSSVPSSPSSSPFQTVDAVSGSRSKLDGTRRGQSRAKEHR